MQSKRSLESIAYVLECQIARQQNPENFFVDTWPINRGAVELYIARVADKLPKFLVLSDISATSKDKIDDESILLLSEAGVSIKDPSVFTEVARLFELHKDLGAVGGRVLSAQSSLTIDGCIELEKVESRWVDHVIDIKSPYAVAQKVQSVSATGNKLGFFRVKMLKKLDIWPLPPEIGQGDYISSLSRKIRGSGYKVAYSPLVIGQSNRL